jgi:hypothetical protein
VKPLGSFADHSSTLMAELTGNLSSNPGFSVLARVPKSARSLHKFTPAQCKAASATVPVQGQDA